MPILTNDNRTAVKVDGIGCKYETTLSIFSYFKPFGPEGVGAVVGKAETIAKIRATLYSGGS